MQKPVRTLVAAALLGTFFPAFAASPSADPTAGDVPLYGTFHDTPSNFVFVKLPTGWVFVAKDEGSRVHEVFRDGPTGFVFVKLSGGWKFVPPPHLD